MLGILLTYPPIQDGTRFASTRLPCSSHLGRATRGSRSQARTRAPPRSRTCYAPSAPCRASGARHDSDGAYHPMSAVRPCLSERPPCTRRLVTPRLLVVHFSVQDDHLRLIVEADDRATLARGVRGLAIRVARAVNRALDRRGAVCADRYHARALTSPRAVRHALIYVLMNRRKHCAGERGLDPCSSAPWFTGWRNALATLPGPPPVVGAHTCLAAVGWRRHGLIDGATECPRTKRPCRKAHHGHLDRYLPRPEDRSAGR